MRQADRQLLELLLRDGDGNPQDFYSDLEKTPDGKLSFIVGCAATGEYYRHTVETNFVFETDLKNNRMQVGKPEIDPAAAELICRMCGCDYPVWCAPNDLWNRVCRREGEDEIHFLCPTCFVRFAEEQGIAPRRWLVSADRRG